MAFNAQTYDRAHRTRFCRVNKAQVPITLPFDMVTVDMNDQYYEPLANVGGLNAKGQRLRGEYDGVVYLNSNMPLPRVAGNLLQEKHAVWSYYGV